jgi:hypothetical protein
LNSQYVFGLNDLLKVPPPMKISRPSGGAKSITFQMKPARNQSVTSSGPSFIPAQPSASPERFESPSLERFKSPSPERFESTIPHPRRQHQHQRGKTSQKYSKPIFGDGTEEESRSSMRPSQVIYPQSTLRGYSTTRAAQLVHLVYIDNLATSNLILL